MLLLCDLKILLLINEKECRSNEGIKTQCLHLEYFILRAGQAEGMISEAGHLGHFRTL